MGKRRGNNEGSIVQLTDGRWQGRLHVHGKRRAVYGKTYTECLEKLDALRRERDDGTFTDNGLTLEQYLTKWLEQRALEVKAKTLNGDRYQCEKYIIPRIGKVKLKKISVLRIQDMLKDLANEVSPATANRTRKVLKNALGQAVRWQLLARNPVDATRKLKEVKSGMTLWTYEEAARFLQAAQRHRLYALFKLTLSTGLRRSEVLGLRWQDVHADHIEVKHTATDVAGKLVFGDTTKTSHSRRRVTIPHDVIEAMLEHREAQQALYAKLDVLPSHGLVFDSEVGTPLSARNLMRAYRALQERAGVPNATFHDLRHWHASMLIEEGIDIRLIARRLGHANPSITLRIYAHMFDRQKQDAPISLDAVLPTVEGRKAIRLN